MHVAQGVIDVGVAAVRLKAVVNCDPAKAGQDPGMVQAVVAAFVVQRVVGQPVGARREQPSQPAVGTRPGFVEVRNRRGDDLGMDLIKERLQVLRALGHERCQRPRRDRLADPVAEQLRRASVGQVLVGDQVQPQRPDPRPVLRRCRDCCREHGGRLMPAGAAPRPRAMFDRRQPDLGQIEHLPRLMPESTPPPISPRHPPHVSATWSTTSSGAATCARCPPS